MHKKSEEIIIMVVLSSVDLFSGIGGITLALRGFVKPLMYCEIDPVCRSVLERNMKTGRLPRAPVCEDVLRLPDDPTMKSILQKGTVDIVTGGWPCVGFSMFGKREGMDNKHSSLFFALMNVIDACARPSFVFLENVPPVLRDGMDTVHRELSRRGYDMAWTLMTASAVGAPHQRKRWFCLAVQRDVVHHKNLRTFLKYSPYRWDREPVPRMAPGDDNDANARCSMLGNAVVPDCVRRAFVYLWTCGELDAVTPKEPLKLRRPEDRVTLDAPPWTKHGYPNHGVVVKGKVYEIKAPKDQEPKKRKKIVVDPKAYNAKQPIGRVSSPLVIGTRALVQWSTPRHSHGATHVLTERSIRDLATQLRFAVDTPDVTRNFKTNPEFVEWMMGYDVGHTALT
jgi:hypothetical protein